jgi:DNA processing protein
MQNFEQNAYKAYVFNHIKKHNLCTDQKLIKSLNNLDNLLLEFNISKADIELSKTELETFAAKHSIYYSCFADDNYPSVFYHLSNPPALVYYVGNYDLVSSNFNLAVVGTRNSSFYAEHSCAVMVEVLQDYAVTVVSGLARGIDLTAHCTALKHDIASIAVIASGHLSFKYYGKQNQVFKDLQAKGLVISEYHPMQNATHYSFAQRNRLISALANTCVVLEAPQESGALITAKHCLDLEKDLYVLVSDINKKSFAGGLELLHNGFAKPLFKASAIISYLDLEPYLKESITKSKGAIMKTNTQTKTRQVNFNASNLKLSTNSKINSKSYTKQKPNSKLDDPLIELLDSGINDFDLLLCNSSYNSQLDLMNHLSDLELQGRVSRRGALFVAS